MATTEASGQKLRSIGRWYIAETLGKGGYSWVKKGYDKRTGKPVALKFMLKADSTWADEQTRQVITEIESLKQINHDNVVKLYAYNLSAKYPTHEKTKLSVILLVLEYAPGGELFDILYYTSALEEDIARTYFTQMIRGLEGCHNAGIAHRDIKPQNLLLDAHFNLKITDFGLSKVFESDADTIMRTSYVGTRGYQAPELLLSQPYDLACDIFSSGVVLFILLTGYPPFEQASKKDRWYAPLANGDYRKFWKGHKGCAVSGNDQLMDLIQGMLEFDPSQRLTLSEIKNHPWFQGHVLEGRTLINALRLRHRKMEAKRRGDLRKRADLENSVTVANHRPIPIDPPDAVPPHFPENDVEQLKDIRTNTHFGEVLNKINSVLCASGAHVEFDQENWMMSVTVKTRNTPDESGSLIKFVVHVWRDINDESFNIVRFTRIEGEPYRWFKVRHMIDTHCNSVFTGDEFAFDENENETMEA